MKKQGLFFLFVCVVGSVCGMDTLFVTKDKVSTVAFEEPITMVDVGTKNIFLFYEVRNEKYLILQEMKTEVGFVPTNCVVTTAGRLYEFVVLSDDNRSSYVFHIPSSPSILATSPLPAAAAVPVSAKEVKQDTLKTLAVSDTLLLKVKPNIIGLSETLNFVEIELDKHYFKEGSLVDNVSIRNKSNVVVEIEYVKCFLSSSSGDEEITKKESIQKKTLGSGEHTDIVLVYDFVSINKNKSFKVLVGLKNNENEIALVMRSRIFNNPSKLR